MRHAYRSALAFLAALALLLYPSLLEAGTVVLKRAFIEKYKNRAMLKMSFRIDHAHNPLPRGFLAPFVNLFSRDAPLLPVFGRLGDLLVHLEDLSGIRRHLLLLILSKGFADESHLLKILFHDEASL